MPDLDVYLAPFIRSQDTVFLDSGRLSYVHSGSLNHHAIVCAAEALFVATHVRQRIQLYLYE